MKFWHVIVVSVVAASGCKTPSSSQLLDEGNADIKTRVIDRCPGYEGRSTNMIGRVVEATGGNNKAVFGSLSYDLAACHVPAAKSDAEFGLASSFHSGVKARILCGNFTGNTGVVSWVTHDEVHVFQSSRGIWLQRECLEALVTGTVNVRSEFQAGSTALVTCDQVPTDSAGQQTIKAFDVVQVTNVWSGSADNITLTVRMGSRRGTADSLCFEPVVDAITLADGTSLQRGSYVQGVELVPGCATEVANDDIGYIAQLTDNWALVRKSNRGATKPVPVACIQGK